MIVHKILTLPDLLQARCQASTAKLNFLDAAGNIVHSLSYAQLFAESQEYAARLISAGLKTDGSDVVITHFADHESHIRIFWACCLGKRPFWNEFQLLTFLTPSRHPNLPHPSASPRPESSSFTISASPTAIQQPYVDFNGRHDQLCTWPGPNAENATHFASWSRRHSSRFPLARFPAHNLQT